MTTTARPLIGLPVVTSLLAGPLPGGIGPGILLAPRYGKPLVNCFAPARTMCA